MPILHVCEFLTNSDVVVVLLTRRVEGDCRVPKGPATLGGIVDDGPVRGDMAVSTRGLGASAPSYRCRPLWGEFGYVDLS
ncbi:hypothetical protein LOC71_10490 [Rhodopirellula sp. JC740]|uniref:Uncharacterized protein n=1 Tax=Rhodopirellula halodulae TaxID=2894198 RepID=A0ABS8NGN4_9BACT|nr:hypothetical protein [Rhodopirellula sp. JC740]MCC9642705.1 hypothetical protein [Rhodopirellula sp. JC740]